MSPSGGGPVWFELAHEGASRFFKITRVLMMACLISGPAVFRLPMASHRLSIASAASDRRAAFSEFRIFRDMEVWSFIVI